jgi:flotillin
MQTQLVLAALDWGKAAVPALIIGVFLGLLFIAWAILKRYKRIAPNVIGVIYGKGNKIKPAPDQPESAAPSVLGFRIVTGGGVFIWPIVEDYAEMSTEAFQIEIAEDNIPTRKNVGVHVSGVATCRISAIPVEQVNAVQNFLGKPSNEVSLMISNVLRGHLRAIVGSLEIEELLRERAKFNEQVVKECGPELSRMGITILNLAIQDVKDKEGFIEALGKQAVAIAKRDAQIATAEAERETAVKTSEAARIAAEAKAQNDAKIKEAEKQRDIQVAAFKKETEAAQAEANMSGEIAKTAQEQRLAVLQAQRDAAAAEAQIQVQAKEAERKQKELEATTIVTAEAEAKAMGIRAEGQRKAQSIDAETRKAVAALDAETAAKTAEGKKAAAIAEGQGESQRQLAIAEAKATATQKTLTAEAEGEKQKLLAVAEGEKAKLLATAEGIRAAKVAEAEGMEKLAEALKQLSEQGKMIVVLDRLPNLLDHAGEAGQKIAEAVFGSVAEGISKIQSIQITDLGGGNTAKNGLANIGGMVPEIIANFFAQMKGRGIDVTDLLSKMNIDAAGLAKILGGLTATPAAAAPVVPAGSPRGDGESSGAALTTRS